MSAQYEHLLIETTPAGVCTIMLNRPARLNAVNSRMAIELPLAIEEAAADKSVRVIVITGAGRGFCAGLDLDPANVAEQRAMNQTEDDLGWVGRWVLAVTNCPKPVIAAINGPAAGAGLGLALAADIRLIKEKTTVTTGYLRIGLSPDAGVSYLLPRLIGMSRAREIIMTARDISAEETERIGLVSRVIASEHFSEDVAQYAGELAAGPPIALALTKQLLQESSDADLVSHLRNEFATIQKSFLTEDATEAMRAYVEKRRPSFRGQ